MSESIYNKLNEQFKDVMNRRNEIIEQFIKTWVAVNVTQEECSDTELQNWFINHCVLCERHIDGGFEYSMRLRSDDEIKFTFEQHQENAKLRRLLAEACEALDRVDEFGNSPLRDDGSDLQQWYKENNK